MWSHATHRTVRLVEASAVFLVLFVIAYRYLFPTLPESIEVYDVVHLNQGWTEQQRQKAYHTSQGTLIIPYSWFLALEEKPTFTGSILPGGNNLFFTNENINRYRIIPDPRPDYNPDRLPVGVTRAVLPGPLADQIGHGHTEWLSYTCAFCHTSQINYKGLGIRIDGGPGNLDFNEFNRNLANLLLLTKANPMRLSRFADRVLVLEKRPATSNEKDRVKTELTSLLTSQAVKSGVLAILSNTYPTDEGFSRMDGLGRAINGAFGPLDPRNVTVSDAPVSIAPLWNSHDYAWVQTIAAMHQPMSRNVTESWGVNSAVDITNPDPAKLFATTVNMKNMYWLETLSSILTAPEWPENILGKIDREAAKRGKYLYEEKVFANALDPAEEQCGPPECDAVVALPNKGLCARCHAPALEARAPGPGGGRYALPMYKLSVIGTDRQDAANFAARKVYTGRLGEVLFDHKDTVGIQEAFIKTTIAIMDRQYKELNVPAGERAEWGGFRENRFRAPLAYPARPLDGFWASAPFLHNNSVPNLYQLLSPVKERQSEFWIGDLEYDPVHIGYRSGKFEGGFEFRTRQNFRSAFWQSAKDAFHGKFAFNARPIPGNSNAGHEFRDAPKGTPGVIGPALSPRDRLDVVEYMKTIRDVPPLPPQELERRKQILSRIVTDNEPPSPQ